MSSEVMVALIAAGSSILGTLLVTIQKRREDDARLAVHEQKQQDALEQVKNEMVQVKKKLDEHNGYAEKIGGIQKDIAVIKNDLSYLKKDK